MQKENEEPEILKFLKKFHRSLPDERNLRKVRFIYRNEHLGKTILDTRSMPVISIRLVQRAQTHRESQLKITEAEKRSSKNLLTTPQGPECI